MKSLMASRKTWRCLVNADRPFGFVINGHTPAVLRLHIAPIHRCMPRLPGHTVPPGFLRHVLQGGIHPPDYRAVTNLLGKDALVAGSSQVFFDCLNRRGFLIRLHGVFVGRPAGGQIGIPIFVSHIGLFGFDGAVRKVPVRALNLEKQQAAGPLTFVPGTNAQGTIDKRVKIPDPDLAVGVYPAR